MLSKQREPFPPILFPVSTLVRVWEPGWVVHNKLALVVAVDRGKFDWVYTVSLPHNGSSMVLHLSRDRIRVHHATGTWWDSPWVPEFKHFPVDPREGEGP